MQLYRQPTDIQVQKIRQRWAQISRFGFFLFVLLAGTALFAFTTVCWVGFTCLGGHQQLLHMAVVWETMLPFMALLSYMLPVAYYLVVWTWMRRVGAAS